MSKKNEHRVCAFAVKVQQIAPKNSYNIHQTSKRVSTLKGRQRANIANTQGNIMENPKSHLQLHQLVQDKKKHGRSWNNGRANPGPQSPSPQRAYNSIGDVLAKRRIRRTTKKMEALEDKKNDGCVKQRKDVEEVADCAGKQPGITKRNAMSGTPPLSKCAYTSACTKQTQ